jgi:hypothetical protein
MYIYFKIVENLFIVPIIGLLLQLHNTRCNLHTYCSIVEILKNQIWNYETSFVLIK